MAVEPYITKQPEEILYADEFNNIQVHARTDIETLRTEQENLHNEFNQKMSVLACRYNVDEDAEAVPGRVFKTIKDCLDYIKSDTTGKLKGKIFVSAKSSGEPWKENIELHFEDLDWSGITIEFDNSTQIQGADDNSPVIEIIGGEGYNANILLEDAEYDADTLTFKSANQWTQPSVEADDYRYIMINHTIYKLDSITENGCVLSKENPYHGNSKVSITGIENWMHSIEIKANINPDAYNNSGSSWADKQGMIVSCAEVNHTGSIKNCQYNDMGAGLHAQNANVITNDIINCLGYIGGGLYVLNSIVKAGNIVNCSSESNYGGFYASYSTVTTGSIENCSAGNSYGGFRAYYSTVTTGSIENCSAGNSYGGFYAVSSTVATGSIKNCSAVSYYGGFYAYYSTITTDSINKCSAGNSYGGFYANHSTVTTGNINICSAVVSYGGFRAYNSTVITGSIESCSAVNSYGGFYADNSTVTTGRIKNCSAENNYGGFYASYSTVITGDIVNCSSGSFGGGFRADYSTVTTGNIESCSAAGYGGAYLAAYSTIASGDIENCSAGEYGGGFYADHSIVTSGNVSDCSAGYTGGAFYASGYNMITTGLISKSSSVTSEGEYFYANKSDAGKILIRVLFDSSNDVTHSEFAAASEIIDINT